MNKMLIDHETALKAARRAAEMAKHGTREEQSGKFLPPPGWKGHLVTAADARLHPRRSGPKLSSSSGKPRLRGADRGTQRPA